MEIQKPSFGLGDCSPIAAATALHSFSRDMQSYYKVARGRLLSRLDQANDDEELSQIKADLKTVNQKIEYFHVLNNAASTVDTLLHTQLLIEEFRIPQ